MEAAPLREVVGGDHKMEERASYLISLPTLLERALICFQKIRDREATEQTDLERST